MESKPRASTLSTIFLLMMLGFASSDIKQDKAECSNQVTGLAPCLPYVEGEAKAPTVDCCSGLKQVLDKSKKCLCLLIQDIDAPSLGLKINSTFAVALPATCGVTVNFTDCISLLHLSPNSQEAKLFEGYQKLTKGSEGVATNPASTIDNRYRGNSSSLGDAPKSDAGNVQKCSGIGMEVALGVSLWIFIAHQNFD